MGINMHNARWCKGPGGAGADGKTREAMKASLHGLKRDKPKAEASHAEQQAAERAKQEAMSMGNGGGERAGEARAGAAEEEPGGVAHRDGVAGAGVAAAGGVAETGGARGGARARGASRASRASRTPDAA